MQALPSRSGRKVLPAPKRASPSVHHSYQAAQKSNDRARSGTTVKRKRRSPPTDTYLRVRRHLVKLSFRAMNDLQGQGFGPPAQDALENALFDYILKRLSHLLFTEVHRSAVVRLPG